MAKGPTVYHVAERAGVSIATVSFTFRQPEKVKASTRELVLAAADELGYVPSASARGLARGRTGALGLFAYDYLLDPAGGPGGPGGLAGMQGGLPGGLAGAQGGLPGGVPGGLSLDPAAESPAADPEGGAPLDGDREEGNLRLFPLYVDEVQRGVELECWRRGQALLVGGGNPANNEAVLSDIAGRVDGLAVFPRSVPIEALARIARRIPVVEVSESLRNRGMDHVTVDNASGARAITEHLINVHGLTELMFIGAMPSSDNDERLEAFRGALADAGVVMRHEPRYPAGGELAVAETVRTICQQGSLPQAFVCATDQDALVVMDVLAACGVNVPKHVAVTGFDGIAAGRVIRPSLTTVRQPMERMGRTMVEMLLDRLDHPEKPPADLKLPVRVVLRESCGCQPV
ncbi:LacI family DNA-binding transcriptional regulator [Pseudarthrobacter cellobiosi]|uniref:LacI family DNA-binding transcriptional regulator n=1 Tax=Pseudarthrobacter cellobiosi TaxID=2953654 RepID=UPI00208F63D1|nr:LacI family DNA-binding transcriptional regulator [Pseudarthrobacter sp. HLT1-5]MCO4253838.1 LacI family transcriptional regulator [Pseudarthrobacter sp. HLT1-5]